MFCERRGLQASADYSRLPVNVTRLQPQHRPESVERDVHQTLIVLSAALVTLKVLSPPLEHNWSSARSEGQQEVKNAGTVSRLSGYRSAGLSAPTLTCRSRALSRSDTWVPTASESS